MTKSKGIAAMPEFVTAHQTAALMSVTVRRVRALLESGKLPGVNYGHQWLIKRDDLARYMVEREARLRGTAWGRYLPPLPEKRKRIRQRRKRSVVES